MWQRFTDRAKLVVFYAQEEAARLGENSVSSEHLLLGLVRERDSVATRVLERLGISPARVREELEKRIIRGEGRSLQDMTLDPYARKALDLAYDEARQLNNNHIGTEHLLLGIIREGEGLSARVLGKLGADLESARREVLAYLGGADSKLSEPAKATVTDVWKQLIENMVSGMPGELPEAGEMLAAADALQGRSLLSIGDLSSAELALVMSVASGLKRKLKLQSPEVPLLLERKTLAMIFEKPSLRTRVSFETGMTQLGGHAINMQPAEVQLGKRESIGDAARTLGRMVDAIMARTFSHQTVVELARHAGVPVINGLSDREHPCQALADFMTIQEKKGALKGLNIAWLGDGNNVCHSNMILAAKAGAHFTVACPEGYDPDAEIVGIALQEGAKSGARIHVTHDPQSAATGADAIFTDVWASMGQEDERAERAKAFAPFQVNQALVELAKPDSIVLHCLPAHRGEEITDEVIDGPHSVVFDEAENRLHAQKAVLVLLIGC